MKIKNILIITYWNFTDPLIQAYTLPYLKIISKYNSGGKIILVTLEKNKISPSEQEAINTVLKDYSITLKTFSYHHFGLMAFFSWFCNFLSLLYLILNNKINYIHAWCTPAGMVGYLLSAITGKGLNIDSYEPHAEAMVENGSWRRKGMAFRILFLFEKLQTKRAKNLIATTEGMKLYSRDKYGSSRAVFFVKPACVDLNSFSSKNLKNPLLLKELSLEDKIIGVYAGKFGGIYLEKEVFDLIKVAADFWRNKFRMLILTSHSEEYIHNMARNSGVDLSCLICKFVSHKEIPDYMGLADFGITPVKPVKTKRYCTPIKNGEYWALGIPVIITKDISDDSEIIRKYQIGSVLEELNQENYLKAIKEINDLIINNSRIDLYHKIRPIAEKHRNFEIAEKIYRSIYSFSSK